MLSHTPSEHHKNGGAGLAGNGEYEEPAVMSEQDERRVILDYCDYYLR